MSDIYGTKWYKIDFHMHTNASSDYRDINYTHRNWLLKCMEQELDCVVISDHNTGKNIDCIKSEYIQLQDENHIDFRPLIIFPAVELTVNGGIHLLVIFSEDTNSQKVSTFLGTVRINGEEGDIEAITNQSLSDVLDTAHKDYKTITIPAHVDEIKGIFEEMQGQTLKEICVKENIFAIEQVDKNFEQPSIYQELNLKHHRVIGSDSHTLEDIGRRFTYIKMGLANFDGLKVALSDKLNKNVLCSDEIEATYKPNNISWDYISMLSIHNGYKIGRGNALEMKFSPWLNTIIGGRGSGKSSIIKMLQYAIGNHENLKDTHPDKKDFFKIGSRNSSGMLHNDINIQFTYHKDQVETFFKKNNRQYIRVEDGHDKDIDYKTIQEFYPITIITQKELFDKALHPEEIFSLIDSKINYYSWEMEFQQLIKDYEESKSTERNLKQDILDKKKIEEFLKQTDNKLKTYEKYNFSQLLKDHAQFKNESTQLRKIYDQIIFLKDTLKNIDTNIDFNEIDFLNELTPDIANIATNIQNIKESIQHQIENLEHSANDWLNIWKESQWNEKQIDVKKRFDELSNELKEQGTDISQYSQALEEKDSLQKKLFEISKKENLLENQMRKSHELLVEINNKREELYNQRKTYIEEINHNLAQLFTNTRVRFSIVFLGDVIGSEEEFRKIIQRQDRVFESQILQIDENMSENSGFLWDLQQCDSIKEQLEELKTRILSSNTSNTYSFGARLSKHFS